MPVVMVTSDCDLIDDDWHQKHEPRENHVWLQREEGLVEVEVILTKRKVAFEDANDHKPEHCRHEEKAASKYPEDYLQFFGSFR
jgi:hypothetical protein